MEFKSWENINEQEKIRRRKRRKRSILKEGFLQVAHGSAVVFHLRGAACRSRRYGSIVFALIDGTCIDC